MAAQLSTRAEELVTKDWLDKEIARTRQELRLSTMTMPKVKRLAEGGAEFGRPLAPSAVTPAAMRKKE